MSIDQFAKLQADFDEHRLDFIKTELALCFTFSIIAARKYETGNQESGAQSMANAEKAYETVIQFLSDPKRSKHLTGEESQDITAELGVKKYPQRFSNFTNIAVTAHNPVGIFGLEFSNEASDASFAESCNAVNCDPNSLI